MKTSGIITLLTAAIASAAPSSLEKRATVKGFDISHYQATVNFKAAYSDGARFVIIKVSLLTFCNQRTSATPSYKLRSFLISNHSRLLSTILFTLNPACIATRHYPFSPLEIHG